MFSENHVNEVSCHMLIMVAQHVMHYVNVYPATILNLPINDHV